MKSTRSRNLAVSIAEARSALSAVQSGEPGTWSHGFGRNVLMVPIIDEVNFAYWPLIKLMSSRFRCMTYSPKISLVAPVTLEQRADELASVLSSIDRPTKVVAWSDAGTVAYHLARRRPELFEHLYLIGLPDHYTLPPVIAEIAERALSTPLERLLPHRLTAMMIAFVMRGGEVSTRDLLPFVVQTADLSRLIKYNILPLLLAHSIDSAIACPVSIAWSERDRFVRLRSAQKAAATLGISLEVVGTGGHFPTFFTPDTVASWIEQ